MILRFSRHRRSLSSTTALLLVTLLILSFLLTLANIYLNGHTETVYETPSYRVLYRSSSILTSSSKTVLSLSVKRGDKPVGYSFTLSGVAGISAEGVVVKDLARGTGFDVVQVDISGYVDEVANVLRGVNADPTHSGLGLLAFVVSKIVEDGEEYMATDIVSIPIIPEKVRGKTVLVEIDFRPVHKIRLGKTGVGAGQLSPPGEIPDYCYFGISYYECYYWRFNQTLLLRFGGIPTSIALVDAIDGDYVKAVDLFNLIVLKRSSIPRVGFIISLTFKNTVRFVAPGPGFYYEISSGLDEETLFSFGCMFYNSKLRSDDSDCDYFGQGFTPSPKNFYDEALLALGFKGYMWLAEYDYMVCGASWLLPGGNSSITAAWNCEYEGVVDKSLAVYVVPYFSSSGVMTYWYDVDDNPYDGYGLVEQVFRKIYYNPYTSVISFPSFQGTSWRVVSYNVKVASGSPAAFGIALPIGAIALALLGNIPGWVAAAIATLSVGISVPLSGETEFYLSLAYVKYYANQVVTFNPRYVEISLKYLVREAGGEYRIPYLVVRPFIT